MFLIKNKLNFSGGASKYFYNTSWILFEQILRLFSGLFVGIWIARYLGPSEFGVFSYVIAYTSIFSSVAKLGLDSILVRELINHPDKKGIYLGTCFWLKFFSGLLSFGVVVLSLQFINNEMTIKLYIVVIAIGYIFQSFEVVDFYFQSQVLVKYVSFCKVIQLLISLLLKIYLILTQSDLLGFIIVNLFDQITLGALLYTVFRYKNKLNFYKMFNFEVSKKLLSESWPLIFSSIVVMIYMRMDQVIIKAMLGDHEAGIYSAAVRLSEVWYFIPTLITISLFPAIVDAKRIGENLYYQRLQKLFILVGWMSIVAGVIVSILNGWFIELLYGKAYQEAGSILVIHIWTGFFVSLGLVSGSWLTNESLQVIAFYRTFFGVIVNLILIFFLMPYYGLAGVAFSTLVAQMMAAFIFDFFSTKTRAIFYMKLRVFNPFVLKSIR